MHFMKYLFVLFVLLSFSSIQLIWGCNRKSARLLYRIAGDELDMLKNINAFTKYAENPDDISDLLFFPELNLFHFFGEINLALFTPKDNYFSDNIISQKLFNLFSTAGNHLRTYFIKEVHDYNTYRKILICCIEYSIRLQNTKYVETGYDINCKRILGMVEDKLNFNYVAEKYEENSLFEFAIN